jgi:hypothetical protein
LPDTSKGDGTLALTSDIPSVSLTTTTGSESITVGSDTLNVVTRDTAQDITEAKNFSDKKLRIKEGTQFWTFSMDSSGNYLDIMYNGTSTVMSITRTGVITRQNFYPQNDNSNDLGLSYKGFRDAVIKRNLTDGTNSVTVANIAKKSLISDEYDNTATYSVGNIVIYNNTLYRCTTAVTTPEDFDSTKWTAINVSDILESGTFNEINASDIVDNTLTQDQLNLIKNGKFTIIKGTLLNHTDTTIIRIKDSSNVSQYGYVCLVITTAGVNFGIAKMLISSNLVISFQNEEFIAYADYWGTGNTYLRAGYINTNRFNGKQLPNYPSNTGTFDFRCVGGTLSYKALGSYVADNTITELSYDNISVIEISADTTFTLKAPASNSMPEYKAKITNSGASAINLTFPSGTVIKTNDENIVIASNVLTLPSGTTIELNIQNGKAIAFNWAVSN